MTSKLLYVSVIALLSASANANVCGTDYQNFNPTTSGLDFVTVQSSETLKPCIMNMGIFLNYAANSLTYSKTLISGPFAGTKSTDRILGLDLSFGMGITDRWDFGVNVPFILSQTIKDDIYVSSYEETGATEIKANTRYHLMGDESGGLAALVSVNQNLIEDNPFAGEGSGLTWNFELAADTTLATKWALGVNVGYRMRDSGDPIVGTPFVPMEDQWIYSGAASYLMASIDTKVIVEIYGSHAAEDVDQDTDRSLNALEGLVGFKYDASRNMALHAGAATQLDASLGGADWRVYAGLNWAIGPVCKTAAPIPVKQVADASAQVAAPSEPEVEVFNMDLELLFGWDSDKIDEKLISELDSFFKEVFHRPFVKIVVEGHTDSIGHEAYNLDLSQRRANFFRDHLVNQYKIPSEKVEAVGLGQTKPIADNGNYQGRRKNRRVDLKITRSK